MFKISIVEDNTSDAQRLINCVEEYCAEKSINIEIDRFYDAESFLKEYSSKYDLIFFDIQMSGISGFEAAEKIRKLDNNVLIVFVTNLEQYAIDGYSISAFDFILKPVTKGGTYLKFNRLFTQLKNNSSTNTISFSTKNGFKLLNLLDISYLEIMGHNLVFHYAYEKEPDFIQRGTMDEMIKILEPYNFSRCNACYIVNLKYVQEIRGLNIIVNNKSLTISQTKRKKFMEQFAKYIGGGVCL